MIRISTKTLRFDAPEAAETAFALLQQGQVISGPTDTVYGLMCQYTNSAAIKHLYEIKGRPPAKAIPVLLGSRVQLPLLVQMPISARAKQFMDHFWPGPLTIILRAIPHLPTILTAGQETLAIRIPAEPRLRALLDATGPLATTSANLSGNPETHSAQEVVAQLNERIPLVLDGGERPHTMASTIVDLSNDVAPVVLRRGPLDAAVQALLEQA